MRTALLFLVFAWGGLVMAADFEAANRFLRDGAIEYGDASLEDGEPPAVVSPNAR